MQQTPQRAAPTLPYTRLRLLLAVALVIVVAVGLWSYRSIHRSVLELRAYSLEALLGTQIEALDAWVGELKQDVAQWAADPQVRRHAEALTALGARDAGDERLLRSPARRALLAALQLDDEHRVGAHLIDSNGTILASRFERYTGRRLAPEVLERIRPVFLNRRVFIHPYREGDRVLELEVPATDDPLFWVEAPVKDRRGRIVAALGIGYRADRQFARIFQAGRPGRTGAAFAFDAQARLLPSSDVKPASPAAPVRLRDPGAGFADPPTLTALASAAVSSRRAGADLQAGTLLDPYRNHAGERVIGAWRWLPEYDMGIAVEMNEEEAYAPLRYLDIGLAAVLVIVFAVLGGLFLPRDALMRLLRGAPQVGPYRLLDKIGEGAISDVYLARHKLLKRPAAVKLLKSIATTDESIARFRREAELASRLSHPNTVAVYDYGLAGGGLFYYAMEYLEGVSFADLVERYGPVPAARAAYLLRQVCASLGEAHAKHIVHRDIKPQNIMVCEASGRREVVKVLDFGLVKRLDHADTRDLTGSLHVLGTPLYMAPERIRDPGVLDVRSDIYSVGAVAFWLLTGRRLFETETEHDLSYHVLHVTPPRASALAAHPVPPAFDELIARCLAKSPDDRPANAEAVTAVLDEVLAAAPWTEADIAAWWNRHWVPKDDPARRIVPE
ncbi:serine/threonine protein kinase [Sulfurifustis variabilis]|uniref:Serine/threonine protein kinase n=1 Tax=Sulfurifustis variabilis TaxID=1675686 RepID=A0A1B4V7F6_9GAMM|nr:serine/threonine protein kinase [Sulfurifustis variabilis]BAU49438.1 serine/threonine protein kinase [Sulfurifustis variabilis]